MFQANSSQVQRREQMVGAEVLSQLLQLPLRTHPAVLRVESSMDLSSLFKNMPAVIGPEALHALDQLRWIVRLAIFRNRDALSIDS